MANTLIGLSNDLKLDVHTQLEDLDDALHSSQTCKVFHGKKAMIQKQVITSSHVYQWDFYLSRLLELSAAHAQLYRDFGRVLPNELRPNAKEAIAWITTKVDAKGLKDADI